MVVRFVVTFAALYGAAFTLYQSTPIFNVVNRIFISTTTTALQLAGGKLEIVSQPGAQTTVRAVIPCGQV